MVILQHLKAGQWIYFDFDLFPTRHYILFTEYREGSYWLRQVEKETKKITTFDCFPEKSTILVDSLKAEENTAVVSVESPIKSPVSFKVNLETRAIDTLKPELNVVQDYADENYVYTYRQIKISDGVYIPVTVLYNKLYKNNLKGMIVNGYGAYGQRNTPYFNAQDLIYANNGLCVVYVYPRGSGEKGRDWYQDGKLLNKKNTFTDFIACTAALKKKYKFERHQIIGRGGSAGGILMGVVANTAPDLFGGLILDRPAIDVTGFMGNPKLPLTTGEYNEWGNTTDSVYADYIASYSPLENIKPELCIRTSL